MAEGKQNHSELNPKKVSAWQQLTLAEAEIMQMIERWRSPERMLVLTWTQQKSVIEAVAKACGEYAKACTIELRRMSSTEDEFRIKSEWFGKQLVMETARIWREVTSGVHFRRGRFAALAAFANLNPASIADLSKSGGEILYDAILEIAVHERVHDLLERAPSRRVRNIRTPDVHRGIISPADILKPQ